MDFFLELGFTWVLSKVLPFVFFGIIGFLVFMFLRRKSSFIKWTSLSMIVIFPLIYFAFNPIYEGDFSNEYSELQVTDIDAGFSDHNLTVLAIPNCPFCYESLTKLRRVQQRTKSKLFDFIVLTSEIEMLDFYQEAGKGVVTIQNTTDFEAYSEISGGHYPTFVYREGDKIYVWTNDNFGVVALDWVEQKLSK